MESWGHSYNLSATGILKIRSQSHSVTWMNPQQFQLSGCLRGKSFACPCRNLRRRGFDPWICKIHCWRKWQPAPVFLPGQSHGLQSTGLQSVGHARVTEHTHNIGTPQPVRLEPAFNTERGGKPNPQLKWVESALRMHRQHTKTAPARETKWEGQPEMAWGTRESQREPPTRTNQASKC